MLDFLQDFWDRYYELILGGLGGYFAWLIYKIDSMY